MRVRRRSGRARLVAAWRQGRTGYPFVDAGMRQLLAEGWMHNRLRMVTASFLVKDLHVWWPVGARHFLDHLLDGDLASNNHGWQWVAGTGTDAAPYFRVFNPVAQGQRFDPDGDVRPPLGPRARPPRRSRGARAVAARGRVRARLPGARSSTTTSSAASRCAATSRRRKRCGVTSRDRRGASLPARRARLPGPGDRRGPAEARPADGWVVAATLLVGAVAAWRRRCGSSRATRASTSAAIGLAAVWAVGAFASGPLHLGTARTRAAGTPGRWSRRWSSALLPLAACLLAGAFSSPGLPPCASRSTTSSTTPAFGSLPVVLVITVLNGIAEELYFRGALYAALRRPRPVAVTTVLYALTTVGSGVPLLVVAAAAARRCSPPCSAGSPAACSARSSPTSRGRSACSCSCPPSSPPEGDPMTTDPLATDRTDRTALVTGASGYIGGAARPPAARRGLAGAGAHPEPQVARAGRPWADDVEVVEGDATSAEDLRQALDGVRRRLLPDPLDGRRPRLRRARPRPRHAFAGGRTSAASAGSSTSAGCTPHGAELSPHLASRVEVGEILLGSGVPTAVLQAAVVLGDGSASFDMLRYLTGRLPAMVAPKWLDNRIQPIAVDDVLHYLVGAADLPAEVNRTFDIGGPEVLTYGDMLRRFAAGRRACARRLIVTVPVLTPRLASHWVGLVTPMTPASPSRWSAAWSTRSSAASTTSPGTSPNRRAGSSASTPPSAPRRRTRHPTTACATWH